MAKRRYSQTDPGLVAFCDIRPGNGAGLFSIPSTPELAYGANNWHLYRISRTKCNCWSHCRQTVTSNRWRKTLSATCCGETYTHELGTTSSVWQRRNSTREGDDGCRTGRWHSTSQQAQNDGTDDGRRVQDQDSVSSSSSSSLPPLYFSAAGAILVFRPYLIRNQLQQQIGWQ